MALIPLVRMWERVEVGRQDSDTTFFLYLMYLGEMASKLAVAALLAAIGDDKDRSRYRVSASLVRADGIGEWSRALDEILVGPPAQHLFTGARQEQRELTQKCGADTWQYQAVAELHACLRAIDPTTEPLPAKLDGRRWLGDFSRLRNKTRGHGAQYTEQLTKMCPHLEASLKIFTDNFSVYRREWAYLHRNLSGKYRVTKIGETIAAFESFKQANVESVPNGVYVAFGRPTHIELIYSDADITDFSFPNGGFNDKRFELLSYVTNATRYAISAPYLNPTTPLPGSETDGRTDLDIVGHCMSNLPSLPSEYVRRPELESSLQAALLDDRHPVVTLRGRGGIGKTSLALHSACEITKAERFAAMLWFSARDLDFLPEGPKAVRPAVLNKEDMAQEFARLLSPFEGDSKGVKPLDYLAAALGNPNAGPKLGPTLFLFDNFETVMNPAEVYAWLDTYVRPPNKILITTRHRDFKGDYPIDVRGMSETECNNLIDSVANRRGILPLITPQYREELFQESDGHPYVVKILLGEVAKAGKPRKVERVVADADEILVALFERTYATLSPAAQRVSLTLCNWRSAVPKIAVEAVLLRPANERMPVDDAIDELERSSFIELVVSEADGEIFITTPLVASLFGKKKLLVSPMKAVIDVDTAFLREFGPGQRTEVGKGVAPRVIKLIGAIARKVDQDHRVLEQYVPMLDFIARHHPEAWLYIADLYEESETPGAIEKAKDAVRHHLETAPPEKALSSWRRLASLCHQTGDMIGEIHALVALSKLPGIDFDELSNAANSVNGMLVKTSSEIDSEEKRALILPIAEAMEKRVAEADATACSRLAWLFLHLKEEDRAARLVNRGLAMNPDHDYCMRLALSLGLS